jgi:hypothetical protein
MGKTLLVTGSSGLIGSEVCAYFARSARRSLPAVVLLVVGRALLMCAYWGADATGLMRECGHPLIVAVVGITCVGLAQKPGRLAALVVHPVFPWLQLPETLFML